MKKYLRLRLRRSHLLDVLPVQKEIRLKLIVRNKIGVKCLFALNFPSGFVNTRSFFRVSKADFSGLPPLRPLELAG